MVKLLAFEKYISLSTSWKIKNDFKSLTSLHFRTFPGSQPLLAQSRGFWNFLSSTYPFHWTFYDLGDIPSSYWNSGDNVRNFLEIISRKTGLFRQKDWERVTCNLLDQCEGISLVQRKPLIELFRSIFPQFFWNNISKYAGMKELEANRIFIDALILRDFDFVKVHQDLPLVPHNFSSFRGRKRKNRKILPRSYLFSDLYGPLGPLDGRLHHGYWESCRPHFLWKALKDYHLQSKEDWYRISVDQFSSLCGKAVPKKKMIQSLQSWTPEEEWDLCRFSGLVHKKARQKYLGLKLRELLGAEVILEDYVFKWRKRVVVFDFYLPGLRWVIEYQGEQHYNPILSWAPLEEQRKRDQEKQDICLLNSLSYITIPYWWDNTLDSLRPLLPFLPTPPEE